jgi:hypothetical protein
MSEPRSTAAPDYLAARLALLALRASVGMNTVLEPDRVAIDGAAAPEGAAASIPRRMAESQR